MITSFQYTLLERQGPNVSDFFTFRMFRHWNTRRSSTGKWVFQLNSVTSDPLTLRIFLDIVKTVSPLRFILLVIVFWHARWNLTVTPFFSLSDKYSCNLSSWIKSLYWISLSSSSCLGFRSLNSHQRHCYLGYCFCHPWSINLNSKVTKTRISEEVTESFLLNELF